MVNTRHIFQILLALSVFALAFILAYVNFGIHSDIIDDSYRSAWWSKTFSKHPIDDFFVFYVGPLKYIYILYNKFPGYQWSFALNLSAAISASAIFFFTLSSYLYYKKSGYVTMLLIVLSVSAFLFIPNILHFSMPRISSLLQVIGLAGIILSVSTPAYPLKKMAFILLILSYLTGTFLRTQVVPVFLVFTLLFIVFAVSVKFNKLKLTVLIIGLASVQFIFTTCNRHPDKKAYFTIDALVTQLNDFYVEPKAEAASNDRDQIRIEAVKNWFFTDRKQITEEFSKKYKADLTHVVCFGWAHRAQKLTMAGEILKVYYTAYKSAVWFYVLTVIFTLIVLVFKHDWRLVCFNFLALIFLMALGLFIKFEVRHLTCVNTLLVLLNLFYLLELDFFQQFRTTSMVLFLTLLIFGIPSTCKAMSCFSEAEKREEIYFEQYRQLISNKSKQHTVVLDLPAMLNYTNTHPAKVLERPQSGNVICYDSGYGTFYSSIRNEWDSLAGGHGADDFFNYLATQNNVIWIGNPDRLLVICKYMRELYQMEIVFSQDLELKFLEPTKNMGMAVNISAYNLVSVKKSKNDVAEIFTEIHNNVYY